MTSYNLGPKLFLAHFTVALVAILTFVFVSFAMPSLFGNLLAGLAATVAAVAASLFVTGRIVGPIRHVLAATRRISAGNYDERVPVAEDDELGALSESFNAMAAALEEHERSRREFISDVSHELNTPLSTLQGYMEGLLDGVIYPTEETWGLMYAETERMRRLVDDLRQLSSAEAGRLALDIGPFPPEEPIRLAAEGMRPLFTEKGCACAVRSRNLANGAGRRRPGRPGLDQPPLQRLAPYTGRRACRRWRQSPRGRSTLRGERHRGGDLARAPPAYLRTFLQDRKVALARGRRFRGVGLAICRARRSDGW